MHEHNVLVILKSLGHADAGAEITALAGVEAKPSANTKPDIVNVLRTFIHVTPCVVSVSNDYSTAVA